MLILQTPSDTIIQFTLFYGFILLGYLFAKISGKGKSVNKYLTLLLVNLLIPLLFINTLLSASSDAISEIPLIIILTVLVHMLGPAFLYLRLRGRAIEDSVKGTFYICVTFNNALFIPLPLVLMFIGASGVPIVIIFSLTQMMLLATFGSFMGAAYGGKTNSYRETVKNALIFPPFLAAVISGILFAFGVRLPEDIANVLSYSGMLTTYLALISVGLGIGIRFSLVDVRSALTVIGIRQLLIPLIMMPIILLSGLSQLPASILILEALMPPAVLTVVYATSFDLDAEKAATIVTVGTLFLLPIIPLIPLLFG
ncbi:hypothetical protein EU527_07155 [Candidatus Thorarchaeota archaeon]|nr:MAG: hypothetical protein EU527_07155 [Candidatus Thorarchaeota archaeon]